MSELSDLTLKIFDREQTGRNANKKIRSAGRIPVILYGKEINKPFSVEDSELRTLLRKSGGTTSLFRLLGESGEDELVLIKELQRDQIKDRILHIDFVQVTRGEDLQTKVPLVLKGEAEGVKTSNGILEVLANDIEIRCRPSKLPSSVELDISELLLGENLQVKDLPALDGVAYVATEDTILVSCVGSASGRSDAEETLGDEDEETDETAEAESEDSSPESDSE